MVFKHLDELSAPPEKLDKDELKGRVKLPAQDAQKRPPESRNDDFQEAELPFTAAQTIAEAKRCLYCQNEPCVNACPLHNAIPQALWYAAQGEFLAAAEVFQQTNTLPDICGRVCPKEALCEGSCTLLRTGTPLRIGKIESFVSNFRHQVEGYTPRIQPAPDTGKHVAIVGSGPTGLTVAELLRERGHAVTVYEQWPTPGGLLLYGIPDFKMDKSLVYNKIEFLRQMGVRFVTGITIGRDATIRELQSRHDAIFIGVGTNIDSEPPFGGADLKGVYRATPFLMRACIQTHSLPPVFAAQGVPEVGRKVAVIGGGDTAMDCIRTAIRLQQVWDYEVNVTCYYRRTEAQMPGSTKDRTLAIEEGAKFEFLAAPTRFMGDRYQNLTAMELIRMELGEPDASGRSRPVVIEESEYVEQVDTAILAIGYWPDPLLGEATPGLQTHDYGLITIDPKTNATSVPGVFAGGDCVTGSDLVVTAIRSGRNAADHIDRYLKGEEIGQQPEEKGLPGPAAEPKNQPHPAPHIAQTPGAE
jgi:glutamate synthase (NADPH/NADH) small chain